MSQLDSSPIIAFETPARFEAWLTQNQATSQGLWLKIAKKASGIPSVTYDEALDIALCYGWIDGLKRAHDADYFVQRFTPRRARSIWSKRNVGKIAELTAAGRMQPGGLAEVERAQADGRWSAAYDSQANMEMPADFVAAVTANPSALAAYNALNRANLYGIAWRLLNVKTAEARQRRFNALLAMLERGEKLH